MLAFERQIAGLDYNARGSAKALRIAGLAEKGKYAREGYKIEIVGHSPGVGGVDIFVRAWGSRNRKIGFGADGSVEIERFRIFNPPVLVDDPNGEIIRQIRTETGEFERRLRFDPKEAALLTLEHNLSIMRHTRYGTKIENGKVGRTTSTFYPAAGASAPVDGPVERIGVNQTWSAIRSATSGTNARVSDAAWSGAAVQCSTTSNQFARITRSHFGFNTAAIGTDEVSAATLSIYGQASANALSQSVVIDRGVPASASALAVGDYDIAKFDGAEQATARIGIGSWNTAGYNDFTGNATMIANVNKSGYSWFSMRCSADFDNSAPSWSSSALSYATAYYADETGTTKDPKFLAEHAPPVSGIAVIGRQFGRGIDRGCAFMR